MLNQRIPQIFTLIPDFYVEPLYDGKPTYKYEKSDYLFKIIA